MNEGRSFCAVWRLSVDAERRVPVKCNKKEMAPVFKPMAVSSENAAQMLGIGVKTLANWRSLGKGPAYIRLSDSPRSQVLYLYEDLESWLRSRPRHGGEE